MASEAQPFKACFRELGPATAHVVQCQLTSGYTLEHILGVVRQNNLGHGGSVHLGAKCAIVFCVLTQLSPLSSLLSVVPSLTPQLLNQLPLASSLSHLFHREFTNMSIGKTVRRVLPSKLPSGVGFETVEVAEQIGPVIMVLARTVITCHKEIMWAATRFTCVVSDTTLLHFSLIVDLFHGACFSFWFVL
jgi:hypothetical protein